MSDRQWKTDILIYIQCAVWTTRVSDWKTVKQWVKRSAFCVVFIWSCVCVCSVLKDLYSTAVYVNALSYLSVIEGPVNDLSHGQRWAGVSVCLLVWVWTCECGQRVYKPRICATTPSPLDSDALRSHAPSNGLRPPPGMCGVSQQLCHRFRERHAHPVGPHSRQGDRHADTVRHPDSRPLELPPAHESAPADDICYGPIPGLHGGKYHRQSSVGTGTAAWVDVDFR